jgi:UDP-2-acetamido-3-amino-2,3-dideoxy-glucuronate N-acetyltransferase
VTVERCELGEGVILYQPELLNLYDCNIGAGTSIGPFVEIQRGVTIGDSCKISSHSFLCGGVTIGDRVFIGHGVMFTNDLFPALDHTPFIRKTQIGNDVVIGSGSTLLPIRVGEGAIIGAGSVVTRDVVAWTVVVGNPARAIAWLKDIEGRERYIGERERIHNISLSGQRSRGSGIRATLREFGLFG